jgi:hypothetical protein
MKPYPDLARGIAKSRGYTIIEPDLAPCLMPLSDWHPDSFIGRRERQIVIFLLVANQPGNGAWRRLLANLRRIRGAAIAVYDPRGRFRDHLARHSWKPAKRDGLNLWLDPHRSEG